MNEWIDYHIKWSKSDKDKYRVSFICGIKKKWYKGTDSQNRNKLTDMENKLMVTKGDREGWEGNKLGIGDQHIHTIIY